MKTFTWVLPTLPRKHFSIAAHSLKLSAGIADRATPLICRMPIFSTRNKTLQ